MPKVDFSGVGEPVADGTYTVQLEKYTLIPAKDDKEDTYRLEFEIVEDGDYLGRRLFRNYTLSGNALFFLKRDLVRMGLDPDLISGEVEMEDVLPLVVGYQGEAKVTQRTYNGRVYNDIEVLDQSLVDLPF